MTTQPLTAFMMISYKILLSIQIVAMVEVSILLPHAVNRADLVPPKIRLMLHILDQTLALQ